MNFRYLIFLGGIVSVSLFLTFCKSSGSVISPFESIQAPDDNPTTEAKIALGRSLFFDTRLSRNNTISCSTCHKPGLAFTDRLPKSIGIDGRKTDRNSPSLLNAGYLPTVMFDAHLETLEKQAIVPIQEHVEMDMNMKTLLAKLREIPEYQKAAKDIFDRDFDAWVLTRSLSAFQRSLISDNSDFDKFYYHSKKNALSKAEKRGWIIFSEKLYCTECHAPPYFTNYQPINNGLYEDFGEDKGRFRINSDSSDIGKFKVPSLRNVALTYPYMHDGSLTSLDEVISHYASGGENHVNKDKRIVSFTITAEERADLIEFLGSLTDMSFLDDF